MSELFDRANQYAQEPHIAMGGRMATRFNDEREFRLQNQAIRVVSEARLLTRLEGVNEEHPGFLGKTISHVKELETRFDGWHKRDDGRYAKTFTDPEELGNAIVFMARIMKGTDSLFVTPQVQEPGQEFKEPTIVPTVKDPGALYEGPVQEGLTLSMTEQEYNMVFNPTRYVDPRQAAFATMPEPIRNRLTNPRNGRVELVHMDIGSPTSSTFALAYELADRMFAPSVSPARRDMVKDEVINVIRKAAKASERLNSGKPIEGSERAELEDADHDGRRYGTAHGLVMEAEQRLERRRKRYPLADEEANPDMSRLIKAELDQMRRNILEGWKPYKDGCVSKVFKGEEKGPEAYDFIMQMYTVASFRKPAALEPEQLAREVDMVKGKNNAGEVRMRVIMPAALIKMVQDNEQQIGK